MADQSSPIFVDPAELEKYCDSTGYLSLPNKYRFMAYKGVLMVAKDGEPIVLQKMDGSFEYQRMVKGIEIALKKIHTKSAGKMGVVDTENLIKKISDIPKVHIDEPEPREDN